MYNFFPVAINHKSKLFRLIVEVFGSSKIKHTHIYAHVRTPGRISLSELPARSRNRYLHNTQEDEAENSMPTERFDLPYLILQYSTRHSDRKHCFQSPPTRTVIKCRATLYALTVSHRHQVCLEDI
jgi:hypothetical protein